MSIDRNVIENLAPFGGGREPGTINISPLRVKKQQCCAEGLEALLVLIYLVLIYKGEQKHSKRKFGVYL